MSIEKVLPDLYRVEVPLPGNPLKAVNSYVIRADRPLVIDTGFNLDACYSALTGALKEIGIDHARADYFVTHLHADHLGLAPRLTDRVRMSEADSEIVKGFRPEHWKEYLEYFKINGFPEEDLEKILNRHPWSQYSGSLSFITVKDGEVLDYGKYSLKAILTPGHTPGHMCLYDEEHKILFSGDHVLFDITPNISYWEGHESLGEYLESLDRVYRLEVNLVLPGHRNFGNDLKKRIVEIKQHHQRRLEEVINALSKGPKNAWQVAREISWDLRYSNWDQIDPMQKWFMMDETIAHLQYLKKMGKVSMENEKDGIRWNLKNEI